MRISEINQEAIQRNYNKEMQKISSFGHYEIGYIVYTNKSDPDQSLRDCIYVKDLDNDEIVREIPCEYSTTYYPDRVLTFKIARIIHCTDNGVVFIGHGDPIIGPFNPRRNYFLLDLNNNSIIDEVVNGDLYSEAAREIASKTPSERSESTTSVLKLLEKGVVCLKNNSYYDMNRKQISENIDENGKE